MYKSLCSIVLNFLKSTAQSEEGWAGLFAATLVLLRKDKAAFFFQIKISLLLSEIFAVYVDFVPISINRMGR